ncbi:hypothetical protein WMY93_007776 [Mugilogobius chulae]|uniref:Uncharacterized protein n=1 Tax=Mugilogobius chulae TaxID=88201 RepID=A0AAW0PE05_9GOBI
MQGKAKSQDSGATESQLTVMYGPEYCIITPHRAIEGSDRKWPEKSRADGVPGPELSSVRERVPDTCSAPLMSIHHAAEEASPPLGASWVILRGRKRGDGERMSVDVCGTLLLFTAHLAPFRSPTHIEFMGTIVGPLRFTGALPDGCPRISEGNSERGQMQRLETED